jgi:hypothetical protein
MGSHWHDQIDDENWPKPSKVEWAIYGLALLAGVLSIPLHIWCS